MIHIQVYIFNDTSEPFFQTWNLYIFLQQLSKHTKCLSLMLKRELFKSINLPCTLSAMREGERTFQHIPWQNLFFNLTRVFTPCATAIAKFGKMHSEYCVPFCTIPVGTVGSTLTPWVALVNGEIMWIWLVDFYYKPQKNSSFSRTTFFKEAICAWTTKGSFIY